MNDDLEEKYGEKTRNPNVEMVQVLLYFVAIIAAYPIWSSMKILTFPSVVVFIAQVFLKAVPRSLTVQFRLFRRSVNISYNRGGPKTYLLIS